MGLELITPPVVICKLDLIFFFNQVGNRQFKKQNKKVRLGKDSSSDVCGPNAQWIAFMSYWLHCLNGAQKINLIYCMFELDE